MIPNKKHPFRILKAILVELYIKNTKKELKCIIRRLKRCLNKYLK